MARLKKTLKIALGTIIFVTLPTFLFFGILYLKYNEDLPEGIPGEQADQLAQDLLNALNYDAYKNTDYLEWTFERRHHYKWDKSKNTCEVYWRNYNVHLNLDNPSQNKAYKDGQQTKGNTAIKLIDKAYSMFVNDSFWLVAPYKVFDPGTERRLVTLENGQEALLVTYTSGGVTPGDAYLWHLDANGKPTHFQMWVSVLPIDGLKATWDHWTTTDSGAVLPTFHKFMIFGIEITDIVGTTKHYPDSP